MGYILKNTSGLINTRLTDAGRQKLSQGRFNISYFQIGDSEVSYNVLPNFNYTNFNVLEPSFNAQNTAGAPQSNKENIKYPIFVDNGENNTYGIPYMDSIVESVYNTAQPRGFFLGTSIPNTEQYNWSALTMNCYAITPNYIVKMNTLNGTNTIDLIFSGSNTNIIRNYKVGDIVTIIYDGKGRSDSSCYITTTTTTVPPTTTTTTTDPCSPPIPPATTTTTTCAPIVCGPCEPIEGETCVVGLSSCYPILTYKIIGVCLNTLTLDRTTPDYSYFSDECYGRVIIYPSGMTEIYDSVTPSIHWNNDVINFESVCYNDQFNVKVWNMNIPWSESPAGLDSSTSNDYTKFGSVNYLGSKEYLGYASSSGQTDTSFSFYLNSFDEIIQVTPEQQKAIAIIHYTNQTIDLFYGEKFATQPFDDSVEDTTGQGRNFKLHLPWLMWHKNPNCCLGQTFWVDPPGFEDLNLFQVNYIKSSKNLDMNDPGIRYFHLWDNNPNVNALTPNIPNRVGKVFPDLKIIVIDDEELIAAMSYKSNRNWTLPAPKVSLITPNICGLDNNSVEGILTGNTEYLYVTYRLSNSYGFTNSLHCNYYQIIQGPNVSCNPIPSQNVSVRFGDEFGCLSPQLSPITTTTTTTPINPCPCWLSGFTMFYQTEVPNVFLTFVAKPTGAFLNNYPIYSVIANEFYGNIYWNGVNWVFETDTQSFDILFDNDTPIGNFEFDGTPISGYSQCDLFERIVTTQCYSGLPTCAEFIYDYTLSGTSGIYTDQDLDMYITFSGNSWVLIDNNIIVATLSGLTSGDTPYGTWTTTTANLTGFTTSDFNSVTTFGCQCITLTTDIVSVGTSFIKYIDCYGVWKTLEEDFVFGIDLCLFEVNGELTESSWVVISGDSLTATTCVSACTTTTTTIDCSIYVTQTTTILPPQPIITTTTTICPDYCDVVTGFYADRFEIICQKVVGTQRPEPTEWKIIDFTDQLSASTINGFITQEGLTGSTFVITQDLYDEADTYVLTDYIDLPSGTTTNLNFGDEYYFYGNIETDIQATIYEMRYKINLGQSEFLTSSNPTWDNTKKVHMSEIGLYDSDKTLMIISKLQAPYPRNGIQQFVVKFDF
jgi:hypothetical protein